MKVFISWSGKRSAKVAEALHDWLPNIIQDLEPWMSRLDIDPGTRWNQDIASQLEDTHIGILCITRSNVNAPWLAFEAGALSKAVHKSRVIPYLVDIDKKDIPNGGPLPQFQAVRADEKGTLDLLHSINRSVKSEGDLTKTLINPLRVDAAFAKWWTDLEETLTATKEDESLEMRPAHQERRPEDLLGDVLEGVRDLQRRVAAIQSSRRSGMIPQRVTRENSVRITGQLDSDSSKYQFSSLVPLKIFAGSAKETSIGNVLNNMIPDLEEVEKDGTLENITLTPFLGGYIVEYGQNGDKLHKIVSTEST